jgi:cytidylate kinase
VTGAEAARPARIVTVDGPAGSGKTTLGRRLASAMGLPLIDTGLFYRGVMVAALRAGIDASDPQAAAALAEATRIDVNTDPDPAVAHWSVRVDGEVADTVAHDPANATLLAQLSQLAPVRAVLLQRQRNLAVNGAVAVGRDTGTVVFPQAPLKIFLEADSDVRAARRADQIRERGADLDDASLLAEVSGRDALDTARAVSPLRPAADAHIIDTGAADIEEMVAIALRLCREAGLAPGD